MGKGYMGTHRKIQLGKRQFRPEELSALVLKALADDARHHLGGRVDEAIISVPAYFNDTQRRATKIAGELAGIRVERLINEPTAAALAYGLHNREADSKFLVLDLGGGTYDVTLLELFDGVIEIHASAGDNFLGGEDFSHLLMDAFLAHARQRFDLPDEAIQGKLLQHLRYQAEQAKIRLQCESHATMHLQWKGQIIDFGVSQAQFDEMAAPLLQRMAAPMERALRDGRLNPGDLDDIILVGGSSRLKCVRRMVARTFKRLTMPTVHPDETIALGAAIQGGFKAREQCLKDIVMTDVTPYTLGIEVNEQFSAGIVADKLFAPIIERNATVPISRSKTFWTLHDHQQNIQVSVFQGESPDVKDNIFLGELDVPVPPKPAGDVGIEVRFTYDINGILEIEVKVPATGQTHHLIIEKNPGAMSRDDIHRCLAAVAHLKIHPRDNMENRAMMARAAKIFELALGEEREQIGKLIAQFKAIMETQDEERIAPARDKFSSIIRTLEQRYTIIQ